MTAIDSEFIKISRAAFAESQAPTLAELGARARTDNRLGATERRDILSALSFVKKRLGQDLDQVRATAPAIRSLFTMTSGAKLGVSEKTLANVRSNLAKAVRLLRGGPTQIRHRLPFSPGWRQLLDQIHVEYQRTSLHRLAAFCTFMNIPPQNVSEKVLLGLFAALETEELVKQPRAVLRNTIVNWNRSTRTIPGWPQIKLSSPFKKKPYTFPLSDFPKSFQEDVSSWVERVTNPDVLDDEAPDRPLRQSTVESRVQQLRQFASALVHQGALKLPEIVAVATLFTPVHFKSAIRAFLKRQGGTTLRLHFLADALRRIATKHCKVDAATAAELAHIVKRLNPHTQRQMSPRNRERLRQFDDPRNVARLLHFSDKQIKKAGKMKSSFRAAKCIERALAVRLMMNSGVRIGNLRLLKLDAFTWSRPGRRGICHLFAPGGTTKTGRDLERELPADVADLARLYVEQHRSNQPGAQGPYLFPGVSGGMRSRNSLRDGIGRDLLKDAGLVMHPHLIRHAVGKIVVERDPGAALAVSRVLGHTTFDTTNAYYLGTEQKAMTQHVDRVLDKAKRNPVSKVDEND